jgi:hypothetical protein
MNNTKLLLSIFKRTNTLIKSEEYKEAYRIDNSFSRKRKLSFSNAVYFICSALRKSLSTEINNFIEEHSYLEFPNISKQAFSKARQNISPEAFKELCSVFTDSFYNSTNINLKKWNGFNVFAVDGTTLQVPDTSENIEYFGTSTNQSTTKTALASASALYDVLNDIVIDATISRYRTSERKMAKQHINSINNIKLLNNSIVIFDRGYPSYDMFNFLEENGLFFLMRVSSSYKIAESINSNDSILNYKFGGYPKEVRVIKVELPDGTIEVLLTNIFDKSITTTLFKELYFLRWGVECKYKELKSSIEIEEFSGTKPIAIEQDFYASIYLSMVASLIKTDADAEIANDNQDKSLKSEYQANRNFILSEVLKKIIAMMIKPISGKRILENLLEKAKKIRSQIRPNRSCERKNKHPRKKHHSQRKSCI